LVNELPNIIPKAIRGPFIVSINRRLRKVPESPRCAVDMMNHIFLDKTQDVGKTSALYLKQHT
jgi:hypothetical protein